MSRVGKKPIHIPEGVRVTLEDRKIRVTGPKGTLERQLPPEATMSVGGDEVLISAAGASRRSAVFQGLTRSLVANMVVGVVSGFEKNLEFEGIGYRATLEERGLILQLGFSHPVRYTPPEGITLKVEKNTITISGMDKETVGMVAAKIRALKPPEPYKGKGIRYRGEVIRRKAGKKAVASA